MALVMTDGTPKKELNRGAWTAQEDQKLAQIIEVHGAKRWKSIAATAGLNRSGKSCRLRWMNYLRPNIKRGNISDQEEDLILRLHKLLGNRWSLIAGRLPGRTDNEIKNYWNSHLSKKIINQQTEEKPSRVARTTTTTCWSKRRKTCDSEKDQIQVTEDGTSKGHEGSVNNIDVDELLDFSVEGPLMSLEWLRKFSEFKECLCGFS
ncbi:PREDICTED: transcription factor MYB114-like [Nelumbo nucifera]|uniref:Transcription factor MYB114-like n=2 Tax=Nelumbo nucifera TaxID=4432 RepID=A0A1U8A469_NELNU|nr:PREDICTED: transcription factor MYB114-like [Nelumbo nucifera]DAD44290.1 TPA_asm: hypothetical protein HUJ06_002520 [Nelumbo nucifera]